MRVEEIAITQAEGLHARLCAQIVHAASRFGSEVFLTVNGRRASARSLLAVMLLAASVGTVVRLEADGPDEAGALREVAQILQGQAARS